MSWVATTSFETTDGSTTPTDGNAIAGGGDGTGFSGNWSEDTAQTGWHVYDTGVGSIPDGSWACECTMTSTGNQPRIVRSLTSSTTSGNISIRYRCNKLDRGTHGLYLYSGATQAVDVNFKSASGQRDLSDSTGTITSDAVAIDTWYELEVDFDCTTDTYNVYLDGVKQNTSARSFQNNVTNIDEMGLNYAASSPGSLPDTHWWDFVQNGVPDDIKNDSSLGDANLVSGWELDDSTASSTWVDSNASNNLTNQSSGSGVTSTTGAATNTGSAASFASASTEYLSITNASQTGLDVSGDFSFAFWYKTSSSTTQMLVDKMYSDRAYSMRYIGSLNRPRMNISDDGTTDNQMDWLSVDLEGDTWRHLVFMYDATAKEGELYVNAVSQGTKSSGATLTGVNQGTDDFNIGARNGGTTVNGDMDQVLAYSKLLTPNDIANLYNGGDGLTFDDAPAATSYISRIIMS